MKILMLTVVTRKNSLTNGIAQNVLQALVDAGHEVEVADLMKENFDPVLREADEPDWNDPNKVYSEGVLQEIRRVERNEATIMVFPIWWWSMPAILKGWIDRVVNHGWAYGGGRYPHGRVWMLGVAGTTEKVFAKRGYDIAMKTQLETGIFSYCGVEDIRLKILYGARGHTSPENILGLAKQLGEEFHHTSRPPVNLEKRDQTHSDEQSDSNL